MWKSKQRKINSMFNIGIGKVRVRWIIRMIWAKKLINMIIRAFNNLVGKRGPKIVSLDDKGTSNKIGIDAFKI